MLKLNSICIMFPVYKDSKTIKKMIKESSKVLEEVAYKKKIVIVDDGCPEKTGKIAKQIAKSFKNVKIIFHKKNLGYGAALKTGFKNSQHSWIFQIDGDAEYSVRDLKKLIKKSKYSDLVITYRQKKKYNTSRIFISYIYNVLLRFLFKTQFLDISTGSRLINTKIFKKVKLNSNSPFIGAELAIKSKYLGFRISEVGINTYPRKFGTGSAVSIKNIIYTIKDMIILFYQIKLKKN
jgi:glycosyltransferase involved in cell wall biosynthesis